MLSRKILITSFIVVATVITVVGGSALAGKTPVNPELYGSWNLDVIEQAGMKIRLLLIIEDSQVTAHSTCSFAEYRVTAQTSSAAKITANEIRILESKVAMEEYSPGFLQCTATLKAGKAQYQVHEDKLILTVSAEGETVELTRFGSSPRAATQNNRSKEQKLEVAYTNRGTAYLRKGQYNEAIGEYTKALKMNPGYAIAYCNRGMAYAKNGHYEKAVADYNQALSINPKHSTTFYNRGIAHLRLGDSKQAIKDFQGAAKLDHKGAQKYLKSNGVKW